MQLLGPGYGDSAKAQTEVLLYEMHVLFGLPEILTAGHVVMFVLLCALCVCVCFL